MESLQKIISNSVYADYAIRNNYTMKVDYTKDDWFNIIDDLINKAKEQLSSNEVETLQNLIYSSDDESQQLAKKYHWNDNKRNYQWFWFSNVPHMSVITSLYDSWQLFQKYVVCT